MRSETVKGVALSKKKLLSKNSLFLRFFFSPDLCISHDPDPCSGFFIDFLIQEFREILAVFANLFNLKRIIHTTTPETFQYSISAYLEQLFIPVIVF